MTLREWLASIWHGQIECGEIRPAALKDALIRQRREREERSERGYTEEELSGLRRRIRSGGTPPFTVVTRLDNFRRRA